jgi:uncharacterized membrane protein
MRNLLNALTLEPELPKPVVAALGLISIILAVACWLLVRRAIEPGSAAEWGLTLLFLGAMSGFMTTFIALIKILIYMRTRPARSTT